MQKDYTSIYLADDHQIVIDGLKLLLNGEHNLRVIGSQVDGYAAFKDIQLKKPDIALIDYRMPGLNGIEVMNSLKKQVETKFIILSMHAERHIINDSINYGAAAYLLKNTGKNELLECILKVIEGGTYFSPSLQEKKKDPVAVFTPRELEILRMIISGNTTLQISNQLHISIYTVETHRKNICRKANAKTALGILNYAKEHNVEF